MKRLRTLIRLNRLWLVLWGLPFLLFCLHLLLTRRSDSFSASLQMIFGCVLALATSFVKPKTTHRLLSLCLIIVVLSALVTWSLLPYSWHADTDTSLSSVLAKLEKVDGTTNLRAWRLSDNVSSATIMFEAQLLDEADFGWDWLRSSAEYELMPMTENEALYTRVVSPETPSASLRKSYDLGEATGGKTFKVSLAMRSDAVIPQAGCRGVMLMAGFQEIGNAGKKCLRVALEQAWQSYDLIWTVPEQVTSTQLHIVLTNLAGYTFDVKDTALFLQKDGVWEALAPLIPDSPYVSVWEASSGELKQLAYRGFYPSHDAATFSLPFSFASPLSELFIRIQTGERERGLARTLELKNFRLTFEDGVTAKAKQLFKPWDLRQRFIFSHANLAGHSVASILLALLVLRFDSRLTGLGFILGLILVWLTGSRTAWIVALLGSATLYALAQTNVRVKQERRYMTALFLALGVGIVFIFGADVLGRLQSIDGQSQLTRQEIWSAAWRSFLAYPLLGSPTAESLYVSAAVPGSETISHAHNLWLEFAARYGLLGLLAVTWLSSGFAYLGWHWGRRHGLVFVAAILAMNIFDYSFFYTAIFVPLILGLNALRLKHEAAR